MSSLSNAEAAPQLRKCTHKTQCHWPPLSCIVMHFVMVHGTWYIFTSTFLTISTHEFPLNFHPSRAAPRSCVATNRVVLEVCSLPPRPEWFYMHASASSSVHLNQSYGHDPVVQHFRHSWWPICGEMPPVWGRGGRWRWSPWCPPPEHNTVTQTVTKTAGSRATRILSATVTRQQGRGSDQTIHLEPSCFYKRLLALFALLDFTLTPRNTDNMFVAPSAMRFCLFATSEEHHVHVDFRRILY